MRTSKTDHEGKPYVIVKWGRKYIIESENPKYNGVAFDREEDAQAWMEE